MASALIVRVRLPRGLERLRRRCVADAGLGVPAHLTLLYPFKAPEELTQGELQRLRTIAAAEAAFGFRLAGQARWPDTVYVAVEPEAPFLRLHRRLATAYPEYPVYGGTIDELVPHVTVAEGSCADDVGVLGAEVWSDLPIATVASTIELIAEGGDGRWRSVRRFRLGGSASRSALLRSVP